MNLPPPVVTRLAALARALGYALISTVAILLVGLGLNAIFEPFHLPQRLVLQIFYAFSIALLALLAWAMLRFADRRGFRSLGFWFYPGWWREAAIGTAVGLVLALATAGLAVATGGFVYLSWNHGLSWSQFFLSCLFLLLAGASEELAFRGYAFQRLVEAFTPTGAVLLTSVLFGVAHLSNPSHPGALSTANTALAGVLLAVAYLRTRGLWLPIALHWSWNFFQGPVFSSPISGIKVEPTLFSTHTSGPDWLSGGAYGFEASLAFTLTCSAAIVWLLWTPSLRATPAMRDVSNF